jgi:hypothetical protein
MTERVRVLEAIARTLEGAQQGVTQLAFAHLPVGAGLRVSAASGLPELPEPVRGLSSPLLGLAYWRAGAPPAGGFAVGGASPEGPQVTEPPAAAPDPGDADAVAGAPEEAGEEDTRVTGPVLVFAPAPEAWTPVGATAAAEEVDAPDDGMEDLPTLHDAPVLPAVVAAPDPGPSGEDPDAFDEPTFLGVTGPDELEADEGPPDPLAPPEGGGADDEATLADVSPASADDPLFGDGAGPLGGLTARFDDAPVDEPAPRPGILMSFARPDAADRADDPFAASAGDAGPSGSPFDDGDALFDDEEEATRVGTAAVSLRAAVDAALRAEGRDDPAEADIDGDQLEFEASTPAPTPVRPLSVAAPTPAPRLAAPRLVEPTPDRPEGATGAAIQILGFGKARTLTPTLALEGAPEELEAEGDGEGGFSVAFEEPDEESTGPRIPMLTEGAPVPERPTVGLSGGPYAPSADAALAPHTAAGFLARARAAEQAGNLRDAVECYGDLLSFDPYSLDAHLGRGRCLVDLGDYGAAMSDFTRAEDLAPDSPEPVVEMGNLYFARKEYKKAIAYYDHAIEQSPNHAMALCRRGICYYHRKRMSEAHADLKRAEALGAQVPGLQRYIQMTARGPAKR